MRIQGSLQAPLYIGLIVAQVIYVIVFMVELTHLGEEVLHAFTHPGPDGIVIEEAANVLKVKLAMAIVGISSIHLLKTFIEVGDLAARGSTSTEGQQSITGDVYTWDGVLWQVIIHMVFIVSAIALAGIDRMSQGAAHAPSPQPGLPVGPGPMPLVLEAAPRPVADTRAIEAGPVGHLLELGRLRDAGIVTDAEFDAKKAELLARF